MTPGRVMARAASLYVGRLLFKLASGGSWEKEAEVAWVLFAFAALLALEIAVEIFNKPNHKDTL